MTDDHQEQAKRILQILSHPEVCTGADLAKRLERDRLPDTIEQAEAVRSPRINPVPSNEDHV